MSLPRGDVLGLHADDHELEKKGAAHSKPPLKPKPVIPQHLRILHAHSETDNSFTKNISPAGDSGPLSPTSDLPSAVKLTQLTGPLPYGSRRPSIKRWTSVSEKEPSQERPLSPLESPTMNVPSKDITTKIPALSTSHVSGTSWKGKSSFFLMARGWGENPRQAKDIPVSSPSDSNVNRHSTSLESKDETLERTETPFLQTGHVSVSSELNNEAVCVKNKIISQHEKHLHESPKETLLDNDLLFKIGISSIESKAEHLDSRGTSTSQEERFVSTDSNEEAPDNATVRIKKGLPKHEQDLHQSPKETPECLLDMEVTTSGLVSPSTKTVLVTAEQPDKSKSFGKEFSAVGNLSTGLTSENQGYTEVNVDCSDAKNGNVASPSSECAKVNVSEQPVSVSMYECASRKREGQNQTEKSIVPVENLNDSILSSMQKQQNIDKDIPGKGLQDGGDAAEEHKQEKHVEYQRHDIEHTNITIIQQPKDKIMDYKDDEDVQVLPVYTREEYVSQHLPSGHLGLLNLLEPAETFKQGPQHDVSGNVSVTMEKLQYQEHMDLQPSSTSITDDLEDAGANILDRNFDIKKTYAVMENEHKINETDALFKVPDEDTVDNYDLFTHFGESAETNCSNNIVEQMTNMNAKEHLVHEAYNEKSYGEFTTDMNELKITQHPYDSVNEFGNYTVIPNESQWSSHDVIIQHTEEGTEHVEEYIRSNAEEVCFRKEDEDYVGQKDTEPMHLNDKLREEHDGYREMDENDDSGRCSLSNAERHTAENYVMSSEDCVPFKTLDSTNEEVFCGSNFKSNNLSSRSTSSPLTDDNCNITADAGLKITKEQYNANESFAQIDPPDYTGTEPVIPEVKYVEYGSSLEDQLYKEIQSNEEKNMNFQTEELHQFTQSENSPYLLVKTEYGNTQSKESKQIDPQIEKNLCLDPNADGTEVIDCEADENQRVSADLHIDQQRSPVTLSDLQETYPDSIICGESHQQHFLESENSSQTDTEQVDSCYKYTQSESPSQSYIRLDHPQDSYVTVDYESVASQDKSKESRELEIMHNMSEEKQVGFLEEDDSQSIPCQESLCQNIESHMIEQRNSHSHTFHPEDHQSQEDHHIKGFSLELRHGDHQSQEVWPKVEEIHQNNIKSEVVQHIDSQLYETQYLDHQSQNEKHKDYEIEEVQYNENLSQEDHSEDDQPQDLQQFNTQEGYSIDIQNFHEEKHDDTRSQEPQHIDDELAKLDHHHSEDLQDKNEIQRDSGWLHQINTESEVQQRETDLEDLKNEIQSFETETEAESEGPSQFDFAFLEGTDVLDTSLMRGRASLGKKRCHRNPAQLACTNEDNNDPDYWMFRDSTENHPVKDAVCEEREERECSPSPGTSVTSPGKSPVKKGGIFAGIMNPSLLKGRLKSRKKHVNDEAAKKEPDEQNLSPKSCSSPEKEGHSLNWLSALKKKKKKTSK